MTPLPYQLDRTITIQASRDTVFRFFTDSARWASWFGTGSTIDARPGGRVRICFPGAVEVTGEVVSINPPEQIVFTYGFSSGKPIPPGGSRVTIRLESVSAATRLRLTHELPDAEARDDHVQGWRFELSLFANVVANEVHADATDLVDGWFTAWAEPDGGARAKAFTRVVTPQVTFRDRNSTIDGMSELVEQTGAYHRFMPGIRLERRGAVRHCQGTVLADWAGVATDGQERMSGTNVFVLGADGRIESATGFTTPPAR